MNALLGVVPYVTLDGLMCFHVTLANISDVDSFRLIYQKIRNDMTLQQMLGGDLLISPLR